MDDAEPLFRRALAGREKTIGREHPDTLQSLNNLVGLLKAQGKSGGISRATRLLDEQLKMGLQLEKKLVALKAKSKSEEPGSNGSPKYARRDHPYYHSDDPQRLRQALAWEAGPGEETNGPASNDGASEGTSL